MMDSFSNANNFDNLKDGAAPPELLGKKAMPNPRSGSSGTSSATKTSLGAAVFNLAYLFNLTWYVVLVLAGFFALQPGGGHHKLSDDTEIGWFEAVGDCLSGDRDWERREFYAFALLGFCMAVSGGYVQWLVLVWNEDPKRIRLVDLPDDVKRKLAVSLLTYVLTSLSSAMLTVFVGVKKFTEQRGVFHPEHPLNQELIAIQYFLQYFSGILFIGGGIAMAWSSDDVRAYLGVLDTRKIM